MRTGNTAMGKGVRGEDRREQQASASPRCGGRASPSERHTCVKRAGAWADRKQQREPWRKGSAGALNAGMVTYLLVRESQTALPAIGATARRDSGICTATETRGRQSGSPSPPMTIYAPPRATHRHGHAQPQDRGCEIDGRTGSLLESAASIMPCTSPSHIRKLQQPVG